MIEHTGTIMAKNVADQNNRLFYLTFTIGWTFYFIFTYFNIHAFSDNALSEFFSFLKFSLIGYAVFIGAHFLYTRLKVESSRQTIIYSVIFIGSITAPLIWSLIAKFWTGTGISLDFSHNINLAGSSASRRYLTQGFFNAFYLFSTAFGWHILYFLPELYTRIEKRKKDLENSVLHAKTYQLKALHLQLNPHFLFNALNSIRGLIPENKETAAKMITYLSDFMRQSLNEGLTDITLRSEMTRINHYCEIEKLRYESNLDVIFDISEDAGEIIIKSNLIHPLVENAIKFGMKTSDMPLQVLISSRIVNDTLNIDVCNTGKWVENGLGKLKNSEGTSTGLENIRQRLQKAYPDAHSFLIEPKDGKVCASIILQLDGGKNVKQN